MAKDNSSKDMPRRKFLKNFGSGVIGTTVLLKTLPANDKQTSDSGADKIDSSLVELSLKVNKKTLRVLIAPQTTLAELLRDELQLTGTKISCNNGECGSCTVLLDDQPVYSCHMLALDAEGKSVTTIEGLLDGEKLHPVQEAFVEEDGMQCGFCTPGQIMAAYGLLKKTVKPNREQIIKGMSGNLCRCAAYPKIIESVEMAAKKMK